MEDIIALLGEILQLVRVSKGSIQLECGLVYRILQLGVNYKLGNTVAYGEAGFEDSLQDINTTLLTPGATAHGNYMLCRTKDALSRDPFFDLRSCICNCQFWYCIPQRSRSCNLKFGFSCVYFEEAQ